MHNLETAERIDCPAPVDGESGDAAASEPGHDGSPPADRASMAPDGAHDVIATTAVVLTVMPLPRFSMVLPLLVSTPVTLPVV